MIRKRLLTATAGVLTAALLTTGYLAYNAHSEAHYQYTETAATLSSKIEERRAAHDEALTQIDEAQRVLDQASALGVTADPIFRIDLDLEVYIATLDADAEARVIADAEQVLADAAADTHRAILPSTFEPVTQQLTAGARAVGSAPDPVSIPSIAAVLSEMERTQQILDIEQAVAAHESYVSDGTYQESAMAMAALAGQEIVVDSGESECGVLPPDSTVAAFVCWAHQGMIFLVPDVLDWHDLYAHEAMRHEIAHALIYSRCGAYDPATETGAHMEAMTGSYAVLYLGADRETLAQAQSPIYQMTEASDAAARQIHDQGCGI